MTEQTLDLDDREGVPASMLYGVTNRSNLLEILGSGIAKPRDAYPKYYKDLLEEVPGHVPVSREPISVDVAEFVSAEAGQFPILFAFDAADISLEGASDSSPWLACRAVPVSHFKELCFRSDEELHEFLEREYENVPTNVIPCRVAPDLFEGDSSTLDSFRAWKPSLPEAALSAERVALADKLAGAYNVLAKVIPPVREWFEWLANEISGRNPDMPIASVEAGIRRKAKANDEVSILTGLMMRSFAAIPAHQGFDPEEVITSIASQVSDFPPKRRKAATEGLATVRQVVSGDIDIEAASFATEDRLFRAMLLALLRPEPARFVSWNRLELPEFREATPQAAIFVGLAAGYAATPVEHRGSWEFQCVLSTLVASLVAGSRGPAKPVITITASDSELQLICNGSAIMGHRQNLLTELLQSDLKEGRLRRIAIELDRLLKIGCVTSRIRVEKGRWFVDPREDGPGCEITVDGHVVLIEELDERRFKTELASSGIPSDLESQLGSFKTDQT